MHHGHGGKSPEEDIDTEKFFASSQKTINDNYSGPSGTTYTGCIARAPESFHKVSDILSLLQVALM
jgi:hypothetical protein